MVTLLETPSAEIDLQGNPAWVKLNASQDSLYRVRYSDAMLEDLRVALEAGEISEAADRVGIQNDAFALAKAGHISTSSYLSLVSAYSNEVCLSQ